MKLVSVVIPTYNRAELVLKAIDSVLCQTYKNIEIIVVDDGSTDQTAQELAVYGDRICYLYKENGGVSTARNHGIRHCKGELIAFLDSDDIFLPDKIAKQVSFIDENPGFGLVLCDYYFIDMNGCRTGQSNRRVDLPRNGWIIDSILLSPFLVPSSVLVEAKLLYQVGLFNEGLKTAEDIELHLKLGRITQIALISEPLVEYRWGGESLSLNSISFDDHVFVINQFIKYHADEIDSRLQKKALFQVNINAARGKIGKQEWGAACKYGGSMFKYASIMDAEKFINLVLICMYSIIRQLSGKN